MCDSCIGCCVGSTDRHRHSISRVRYCRQGRHGCLETPIPQREGRVGYSLRLALPPSLLPSFSLSFISFSLFCYFYHSTISSSRLSHLPSPLPFSSPPLLFSNLLFSLFLSSPLPFPFLTSNRHVLHSPSLSELFSNWATTPQPSTCPLFSSTL